MPIWLDGSFALAAAVVFIGSFLQAVTGFGFAMFAAPLLVVIAPDLVPGPILLLTLVFTMGVVRRERRNVDWPGLVWILLGRLPFTCVAALAMSYLAPQGISVIFALFVLAGVALSVAGWRIEPSPVSLFIAGSLSGFFGTLTSIGAPPLALIYQHQKSSTVRGTLAVNIVVGSAFSLVMLQTIGGLTVNDLTRAAALIPFSLLGLLVSKSALSFMNDTRLRKILLAVTTIAALTVLVRAII